MPTESLTRMEADAFMAQVESTWPAGRQHRDRLLLLLMLDAGLRLYEAVHLHRGDVTFNNLIAQAVTVPARVAKTKQQRVIPMSPRIRDALMKWLPFLSEDPGGRLFSIGCRQVQKITARYAQRAFGRPIHPHVLRHTYGTRLMEVTDLRTVQELLGHASISSTQIYTHPSQDRKAAAIAQMNGGPRHGNS